MPATIGVDLASVDGNSPPDFKKAYAAGIRFVIIRAIYGRSLRSLESTPYRDPIWARDHANVRASGLKLGAYLFLCVPKAGAFTPEPEVQANALVDYASDLKLGDFPPFVDVEEQSALDAVAYYDWVYRACKTIKDRIKTWPGIYTSARVWSEYLANHFAGDLIDCPLWIAKPWPWPARSPIYLDGGLGYNPALVSAWGSQHFIYQYQGDSLQAPGFTSTVDANRFNTLKIGAKSDAVKWLQRKLNVVGLSEKLVEDGSFGAKTDEALKTFQQSHGLAVDGIYGIGSHTQLAWYSH